MTADVSSERIGDGPPIQIGYCTNVHAGRSLAEAQTNIELYSFDIKDRVCPDKPMGIGLWFSAKAAGQLVNERDTEKLRDLLAAKGLIPFTINGFPYGDFHESVVKHKVYQPSWAEFSRLNYTLQLAKIHHGLLDTEFDGSISTLPLGWPTAGFSRTWNAGDDSVVLESSKNLHKCAAALDEQYQETGQKIRIAIEPEPGCLIDNAAGVQRFYEEVLLTGDERRDGLIREYIGICHDICHSAVMFESQEDAIRAYTELGIRVVKVQVSSAIEVCFDKMDKEQESDALIELNQFVEERYLHQTCVRRNDEVEFFEDLPLAISRFSVNPQGTWRVHFHLPIFAKKLDLVETTQNEIKSCIESVKLHQPQMNHYEIETYAWNVLPKQHQPESLVESVAREIAWFRELL